MNQASFAPTQRASVWQRFSFLLGLLVLLFPLGSGAVLTPTPAQALVRVEVRSQAQLEELAAAGTMIYAQLYAQDGTPYLLMPADAGQQRDLARLGYSAHVLEADSSGAQYYLLYGMPDELSAAEDYVVILALEGRQAIARLLSGGEERLAGSGLRALPLVLHPLPMPRDVAPALPQAITPSPIVQGMLSQVEAATLYNRVGDLSGEWPVYIDGSLFTIATRSTFADAYVTKATQYVYNFFQSQFLTTSFDTYSMFGAQKRNVIAEQTGLTQPERIFLLTAHVDSTSTQPYTRAPGADDNASGTVAMMTIAEILSHYDFGCTLRYAAFTGEEQGLFGSRAYAIEAQQAGEDIEAVLNMDMLAYNTPSSPATIELHTRYHEASDVAIATLFSDTISAYSIGLIPLVLQDGLTASDHSSFWERGYPAILAIEDWDDHTPYYHTTYDQLSSLNMSYYTEFVKAALATFAHMGCLLDGQVGGVVSDASTSQPIPGVRVLASSGGIPVRQTAAGMDGAYLLPLRAGAYDLFFSSVNHRSETVSGVAITQGQAVTLNHALQPCGTVSGTTFSLSSPWPSAGETVTFTATVSGGDVPITYTWNFGDGTTVNGPLVTHAFSTPGPRLVELKADNSCNYPDMVVRDLFVKVGMFFLPTIFR